MIVETKFEVGQKVYLRHEDKIKCGLIYKIFIELDPIQPKIRYLITGDELTHIFDEHKLFNKEDVK